MPKLSAEELDEVYRQAEECDKELFAEMRSNVLLVSGDHYQKRGSKFWNRIRNESKLTEEQKLRLTKNHIRRIVNEYESILVSSAPTLTVMPANPSETQDQKTADLNNSVLTYYKDELELDQMTLEDAADFVTFGEVWSITLYDPDQGSFMGYETTMNEMGEEEEDTSAAMMEGKLTPERILAFNVLRSPEAQSLEESPFFIRRKMIKNEELKRIIGNPEDYSRAVNKTEETYIVFNHDSGKYERNKNETMVREHFYKPSKDYPKGYFYIATSTHIIAEGELPFGIFPINYKVFDRVPTSPRGRSAIRQMRPYQIEINRSASAIATAQITLGDDKIITNPGAKIAHGGQVPGVRAISATGSVSDIKVIPGRSGEQYVPYMEKQISELYQVMNLTELDVVNSEGKLDPYAMLFRSIKNKQRFNKYTAAFESFQKRKVELLLDLARHYLDDNKVINIVGRSEIVNITEFKHSDKNKYRIKVDAIGTDAETMLGKQISINHALQYVGNQLEKDEIGKLLRAMPYLNQEEAFDDLVIDYDNAKNDILALERGDAPPVNRDDNHSYLIRRLVTRMKKPDFKFLPPEVQQNFALKRQAHELVFAKIQAEKLRLQQGMIPVGGYLVTCDFYTTSPEGKTQRVRLPYESVRWLIEQLKAQGNTLEELQKMQGQSEMNIMKEMTGQMATANQQQPMGAQDANSASAGAGQLLARATY
jgi:hypothetical protein